MTSLQRKKAQAELELLRHRKAKAEALGPDVIRENQGLYDSICARISALQDDLAVDEGGVLADLLGIQREILNLRWQAGALQVALLDPRLRHSLEAAERELVAAHNQRAGPRYRQAVEGYRAALLGIHASFAKDPQISIEDWEEITDEDVPWT